ncbi:hypothetical protein HK098_007896 [Nowakowskiella sp. JEL0407]|nr:hypothetical protein HK098_007896 [Nowakowskiella sp. JEL0407]
MLIHRMRENPQPTTPTINEPVELNPSIAINTVKSPVIPASAVEEPIKPPVSKAISPSPAVAPPPPAIQVEVPAKVEQPSLPPPKPSEAISATESIDKSKLYLSLAASHDSKTLKSGDPIHFPSTSPVPLVLPEGEFKFGIADPILSESEEKKLWYNRSQNVVASFRHAWNGYVQYAWGRDELHPVTQVGSEWFHLGLTAVDALDTAWIMGQTDVFEKARSWVEKGMKFDADVNANLFEITIRVLGGLLSSYYLSKDQLFLDKAVELADKLMPAFTDSSTKIPLASINFAKNRGVQSHFNGGASSTAEVTTLQLEYKFLALLTGNPAYWKLVDDISKIVDKADGKKDGLVPIFISVETMKFEGSDIRLGSRGDSYYEYLAKQWIFTNQTETTFFRQHNEAIAGVKKHLLARSASNNYVYVGEIGAEPGLSPKMDHLVCFLPASLAVATTGGKRVPLDPVERSKVLGAQQIEDLVLAEELARSCYEQYNQSPTGLSPEIVHWKRGEGQRGVWTAANKNRFLDDDGVTETATKSLADFDIHEFDGHNLLRPETVESLFTLYRITGDRRYRVWGWRIFRAFEKWTKVDTGGYSSLDNVIRVPPGKRDKMETFFLGETLKYLYLLFSDESLIPLDEYVFNTEAHPFPIVNVDSEMRKKVGI